MKDTKRITLYAFFTALLLSIFSGSLLADSQAGTTFVTIGSGDPTGVYYPTGRIIAKMINGKREELGMRATVESTRGSIFNVNAIIAGSLEFALVQSDVQYKAVNGLAEWAEKGQQKELRSVCSIHRETVNLVAAVDAGINTIADLKGKRVNLGNPRSGQYLNAIDALRSAGLDPNDDITAEKVKATDAPLLLQDNRIDAFFCTLGHPSETLKQVVAGPRKVRFIPITGFGVDRLIEEKKYYEKTVVPVGKFYRGAEGAGDVETFGVTATLCTSSHVSDRVVYLITKELFDNFDHFIQQHPAYEGLNKRKMLEGLSAPIHPGALQYFKETGLVR